MGFSSPRSIYRDNKIYYKRYTWLYSYDRYDKCWNKKKVRKIIFNVLNSAIKWKKAVDKAVGLPDGNNIPAILVENKVDLLEKGTTEDKDKYFEEFS